MNKERLCPDCEADMVFLEEFESFFCPFCDTDFFGNSYVDYEDIFG